MPAIAPIVCFGEILWDCLPRGIFLGGAPGNVAAHLSQLGRRAILISALGSDFLGEEARQRVKQAGVEWAGARVRTAPTGFARAVLDARGQAVFAIGRPAAWDFIRVSPKMLAQIESASALVFGSLAARSSVSYSTLQKLLAQPGPLKIFDVNLRPPFSPRARVLALARQADVVKLNDGELAVLSGETGQNASARRRALARLRRATGVTRWCVTLGAQGALWWDGGACVKARAPVVKVRDTVGAGDAFLAALVDGLVSARPSPGPWPGAEKMAQILARACRLGALVASRDGACPEYRLEEIA